jgi:hypothetical protein
VEAVEVEVRRLETEKEKVIAVHGRTVRGGEQARTRETRAHLSLPAAGAAGTRAVMGSFLTSSRRLLASHGETLHVVGLPLDGAMTVANADANLLQGRLPKRKRP